MSAIAELSVPEGASAELLVVNNASTDGTAALLETCLLPNMPLRTVFEPRRGLGHARNAGMARASGDVILFTDDDVRVPREWLRVMCEPIIAGRADAVSGGVEMAPHLRRNWMTPRHRGFLACTGPLWTELPPGQTSLLGASMAFSKEVLKDVPRFDPELGAGGFGSHEETLFSSQIKEAGYRVAFVDVVAEHHFDETRLSRAGLLEAAAKMGRSSAYMMHHWNYFRIKQIHLRLAAAALRLACCRAKERLVRRPPGGCSEKEMALIEQCSLYRQFLVERRRPRNYGYRGLTKRSPE